jgi:hypothetical protein
LRREVDDATHDGIAHVERHAHELPQAEKHGDTEQDARDGGER